MESYVAYAEADVKATISLYQQFELYFRWLEIWEQIIKPPLPMLPAPKV